MPGMYQAGYCEDVLMPRLETPPQMLIKQEPSYSPLTPDAAMSNSFGLMLSEPSLAPDVNIVGGGHGHGPATYVLAGADQNQMYHVGPTPCQLPYGLGDVTGIYQGGSMPPGVGNGVNERFYGTAGYEWSNDGL